MHRALFGALLIGDETASVRRRARIVIALSILICTAIVLTVTLVVNNSAAGLISNAADQRGQEGVKLLTTVGDNMPDLTRANFARGLSRAADADLDAAVQRGQRAGVLTDLRLWTGRGTLFYPNDDQLEHQPPARPPPAVINALRGRASATSEPSALDLSTHRRTGALDAYEPLFDADGRVYGAVEIVLPLAPIVDQAASAQTAILLFGIGGAALVWILLLPFTVRAAVGIARSWVPGRRKLLEDFRGALANREIELAYQPQISAADGVVWGFEALVRWRRGAELVAPDAFLPVIECSALMTKLSDRVVELAVEQLAIWRAAGHALRVSVNLSARDLDDEALAERISAALARHGVPPSQLTLEVTETAISPDVVRAKRVMDAVQALGVEISVDDFGTGHASISRLYRLSITEVKIDQSFVARTDERTRRYLTAMVRFAQSLGLRVVAEGVEDEPTLAYLRELGCELAQGYHIAKPMPADQVLGWLGSRRPGLASVDKLRVRRLPARVAIGY
jgi:EAL domain-containing protein (putative c-di-GMP-specific phosphodiesterase class I)